MNRSHIWADIPSFCPLPFLIVLSIPTSPSFLPRRFSPVLTNLHTRASFYIFVVPLLICLDIVYLLPVLYLFRSPVYRGESITFRIFIEAVEEFDLDRVDHYGVGVFIVIAAEILQSPKLLRALATSDC